MSSSSRRTRRRSAPWFGPAPPPTICAILEREQVRGEHGFFDAIDYSNRQPLSSRIRRTEAGDMASSCRTISRITRA